MFPMQKCAIFSKFKKIKELRGGILVYAAQTIPLVDAEIGERGHLWAETKYREANRSQAGLILRTELKFARAKQAKPNIGWSCWRPPIGCLRKR